MILRKLEFKDAPFMLEWMKDKDISKVFKFDFTSFQLEDVEAFIKNARIDKKSYHFAITDNADEYLGTVSIKNIELEAKSGEYAIVIRSCAQGKVISRFATDEILRFAFNTLKLEKVYLNVLSDNKRAIRFYERFGFIFEGEFMRHICIRDEIKDLRWYRMMKNEYEELGCD